MAKLRNISSSAHRVGGWQKRQVGGALFKGKHGVEMVRPVLLQPGESIEVAQQSIDDPIVVGLARSADFDLIDVETVPGSGVVDANPSVENGAFKLAFKDLTVADLTEVAVTQEIIMETLPAGSVVQEVWTEISAVFNAGGAETLDISVGTGAAGDAVLLSAVIDHESATGLVAGTAIKQKWFPAGLGLILSLTGSVNLDTFTVGAARLFVSYSVV